MSTYTIPTTPATRTSALTTIGRADERAEAIARAIAANLPEGFDPAARGAIANVIHQWAGGKGQQTVAGPEDADGKAARVRTPYGKGLDAVAYHLRPLVKGEKKAAGSANLLTRDGITALAGKTDAEVLAAVLAEIATRTADDA